MRGRRGDKGAGLTSRERWGPNGKGCPYDSPAVAPVIGETLPLGSKRDGTRSIILRNFRILSIQAEKAARGFSHSCST